MNEKSAREAIVEYGRLMYQNGLVAGYDGNLSVRLDENRIVITPTGVPKGFLTAADPVLVDIDGRSPTGLRQPSSEMPLHLAAYRHRPDIGACCHAHPPYATAFASTGRELPENILPEAVLFFGRVPLTEYMAPGVAADLTRIEPLLADHEAFLLRNHGALTLGRDLPEAYFRMETVEHYARIVYIGQRLGTLETLDRKETERLEKLRINFLNKGRS